MYTIVLTLQFASFAITSESRKMGMVFRFTNGIYSYIWATFFLIMSTKNSFIRERQKHGEREKKLERVKVLVQVKVYYYTQMELEYEFQPEIRRFFTKKCVHEKSVEVVNSHHVYIILRWTPFANLSSQIHFIGFWCENTLANAIRIMCRRENGSAFFTQKHRHDMKG